MQSIREIMRTEKIYLFGSLYVILSIIVYGIINYFTWTQGIITELSVLDLLFWASLYLPMILFNKFAGWQVGEFGFVWNKGVLFVVGLSLFCGGWLLLKEPEMWMFDKWYYSLIEAVARTGEELYFRGFVYVLVVKLFRAEKRPHVWAIIISSIVFALPHTQNFLPENGTSIIQTLLIALVLAYLRYKIGSLLPGITLHCLLKGNLLGMLFGWAIYGVGLIWSRVETSGIEPGRSAA